MWGQRLKNGYYKTILCNVVKVTFRHENANKQKFKYLVRQKEPTVIRGKILPIHFGRIYCNCKKGGCYICGLCKTEKIIPFPRKYRKEIL